MPVPLKFFPKTEADRGNTFNSFYDTALLRDQNLEKNMTREQQNDIPYEHQRESPQKKKKKLAH